MPALVTRKQMQEMDRIAIDELGIPSLVLMEVAGRAVADAAESHFRARADGLSVLVVAGTGNNGGDAIVAVRHLVERGVPATLVVLGDVARHVRYEGGSRSHGVRSRRSRSRATTISAASRHWRRAVASSSTGFSERGSRDPSKRCTPKRSKF